VKHTYITKAEAAETIGVTTRTIDQMIADGRLIAYRLGPRIIRLRREEIDASFQQIDGGAA